LHAKKQAVACSRPPAFSIQLLVGNYFEPGQIPTSTEPPLLLSSVAW
jgi:hypothetical protein